MDLRIALTSLQWPLAFATGLLSVRLVHAVNRQPAIAWVLLVPLAAAMRWLSPPAVALVAAMTGAALGAVGLYGRFAGIVPNHRYFVPAVSSGSALVWGICWAATASWWRWRAPAWGLLVVPSTTLLVLLPLRLLGAPRFIANPLARTQEPWLPVVHTARVGGDFAVAALLALASSIITVLLVDWPPSAGTALAVLAGTLFVALALALGYASFARARKRSAKHTLLRVGAVAVDDDGAALASGERSAAAVLEATIARYAPHVNAALARGVRLLVLPEGCALLHDSASRDRWFEQLSAWSRAGACAIVCGVFDVTRARNELVIVDATGRVCERYEKQHPGPAEPRRQQRERPARARVHVPNPLVVSAVICVDLDYGDLVPEVRARGGILAAPSNDWRELEALHHRAAVWSCVLSRVPLVRSTTHGTSAIYDAAGRVVAAHSTFDGPTLLVADVPVTA